MKIYHLIFIKGIILYYIFMFLCAGIDPGGAVSALLWNEVLVYISYFIIYIQSQKFSSLYFIVTKDEQFWLKINTMPMCLIVYQSQFC